MELLVWMPCITTLSRIVDGDECRQGEGGEAKGEERSGEVEERRKLNEEF